MTLENNQFDGHGDIAQFLEKFKENTFSSLGPSDNVYTPREGTVPSKPAHYDRSFEKLEQKIQELEERFEASATQNQMILSELARTREAMERQKDRDAFLDHISRTIANLKASVENLSRAQQNSSLLASEPNVQRSFDPVPQAAENPRLAVYHYQPTAESQNEKMHLERAEKERIISSLRQKASQLKAVNSALDREIKKVQQEKMEALKKSAEQAKEILSLRDQLTAAEERFKSFDFEGRIISIKQEYQQKVSNLENQLQEISDTCMKQVEEIESLKAENLKLHKAAEEKEAALQRLEAKERELLTLKAEMTALQQSHSSNSQKQLAEFSVRLRDLEGQRDGLAVELEQAQASLDAVRQEKEVLEKNFKELLEKINNNDVVIEDLKRKIEVLGQQNEELSHHNEELTHSNAELAQQNAALQSANTSLNEEKLHLSARANELGEAQVSLAARADELAREKEELSMRAETLANEKRELSARAEALTHEKGEMAAQTENLTREKEALEAKSRQLGADKETLEQSVAALNQEKAVLNHEKETLSKESQALKLRTEALESETKELAKENQQLRNQSAALLAARLVQEKERADKEEQLRKAAASRPAAPAKPTEPVLVGKPSAPKTLPAEEKKIPASERPVTVNQAAKPKVMTEADLPEIKVADPIPQPEPLFDGEDFLEKTDSFIGRMKWSIFREDR